MANEVLDRPHDALLSRDEAAKYLGISAGTLNVWASTKRYSLPYLRVGRCARYRRSDLDAWLASRAAGVNHQDNN